MAIELKSSLNIGPEDLFISNGSGLNTDITVIIHNVYPYTSPIAGPSTGVWEIVNENTLVSLNLTFTYDPNGNSTSGVYSLGNVLINKLNGQSITNNITIPTNSPPGYKFVFVELYELEVGDLIEISVNTPSGQTLSNTSTNLVEGIIRGVEIVSNVQPPSFSYLGICKNGTGNILSLDSNGIWSQESVLSNALKTSPLNSGTSRDWRAVCYGNGRFVAVNATDRMVIVSLDNGKTWISSYLPNGFIVNAVNSIVYGNGFFAVPDFTSGNIAISSNGLNWSLFQNNFSYGMLGVSGGCYAEGKFVWACQSGHILLSEDNLQSFQLVPVSPEAGWINIKYGNGLFVLIENGSRSNDTDPNGLGSKAAFSTDLVSWTYNYLSSYSGWTGLVYVSEYSKFYATSYNEGNINEYDPSTYSSSWGVVSGYQEGTNIVSDNKTIVVTRGEVFYKNTTSAANPFTLIPYPNFAVNPQNINIHAITAISQNSVVNPGNGPFNINITATNGTVTKSNPGPYYTGDVVLITATPDAGYRFGSWTGDITGTVNPYNFIVTGDVNATANFVVQSVNAVGLVRNLHTTEIDSEELLEIPIEVSVVDASQNVVDIVVDITAEMYSGNGILMGTTTVTSVNGVATFTNLTIQGAGYNTILFTSPGLNPILSAAILVNNAPVVTQTLMLDTQPFGAISGQPLTQQPATKVVDINGDLILGSVNVVTVSLLSGNAVLSGTTSVTSVDGYAAFTDLVLTGPTGPVTLQFSSPGFNTVISQSFQLTNNGNNLPLSGNFPIRPKSSKTPNKAPTSSDLVAYELAVNLTDQKIYMRDDKNTVYLVGDVSSGSSTPPLDGLSNVTITNKAANDLLRWNGTAWVNVTPASVLGSGTKDTLPKWGTSGLVDSSVTDSGTYITSTNASVGRWANNTYAQFAHSKVFSSTASTDYALLQSDAGVTFLNSTGVLHFRQSNGEVAAFNQGNFLVGYADGDSTTYKVDIKGTLHATGDTTLDKLAGTGNRMVVANASGTLATDAIPDGTVTSIALTSDSKELTITGSPVTDSGTIDLALSSTGVTAGSYTNTDLTVDASGRITSAKSGSVADLTAGNGINVTGTYPSFTITNSAPDQEVTLTAGTGMSVTGTYPGFTLATTITQYTDSDARKSLSAGTGISYDSNTGVISNSAPDQTVKLTAGTGIKTSGTYPDFTVTNDAPDQTVTLSAGSGIAVTGTYPSFTVSSTITQYTDSDARKSLSAGTGISYNSGTGVITNASPDQTVTLTAGTGIGVSGTYPSFTVTNNSPDQTVSLTAGSGINITGTYPSFTITSTAGNGSVTSVDMTVPTGLKISGAPITGSGTLALTLDTGYLIPTTSSQSNWDTAYSNRITSLTTTGSSGSATLSSNTLNIPTYTLAGLGGIKLTDLSSTATGLTYTNTTGVFSLTFGYSIPTTSSQTNWDSAYSERRQWDGGSTNLVASTGRTSLGATTVGSNFFTLTNPTAVTFPRINADNTVSALDASTFRTAIGAGTSSTTGTVTSVAMTVPTGLSVSGSPVTSTGTLGITFTTGYSIPTTASQTNWDTAYTNRITSLTTTGNSGAATLTSNTLNIPTYTLAGLGGQASSTNLTSLSGLTYTSASFVKMTAAGTFGLDTSTYLTANQSITLSGDVTGSGSTAITVTLATVGATKGGTGQTTYTTGDILYSSASNTLSKLSGNTTTTRKFLRQTGNGTASAAPAWDTVTKTDVGLSSVENTALSTWAGSSNITTVGTLGGLTVSGTVNLNALIYPSTDGTAGQVLSTNGAGTLSWATVSGGSPAGSTGDIQYNDGSGNLTASSNFSYGSSAYDQLALYSNNAALGVLGVFGASGQTYPLLEFRDYLGNSLNSGFDSTGNVYAPNLTIASSGRLTLASGNPVPTTDQTSKTTIYYTPFNGDKISLYNGSYWKTYTFTEISTTLGSKTNARNYDVFLYDNGGTLALDFSAAWNANNITRTDSLTLLNGVYVKSTDNTRRYLGTIRMTSTTTTEDSITKRFVWNANNAVDRAIFKAYTTAHQPINGTTAGWRDWDAPTAGTTARVEFVFGLDRAFSIAFGSATTTTASPWQIETGAAFDGANPGYDSVYVGLAGTGQFRNGRTYTSRGTFLGYHYIQMKQYIQSTASSNTFYDGRLEGVISC